MLVACKSDVRAIADARDGDGDGAIDGDGDRDVDAPVDAPVDADPNVRGIVSVHIVDRNGAAVPGMHVVFIDTDATVSDQVADAAGMTSANVFPNASVTAIREVASVPAAYQLTTVLALNPGDTITLIAAPGTVASTEDTFTQGIVPLPAANVVSATKQGSTGTFTTLAPHGLAIGDTVVVDDTSVIAYRGTWTVTATPSSTQFAVNLGSGGQPDATGGTAAKADRFMVTYPAYVNAASYSISSPCGTTDAGTGTTATILLRPGCSTATMDLVVVAKSGVGAVLAWTQATNVAFTANGNTTVTAAWQSPSAISATYSNTTTQVTDIGLARFAPYIRPPSLAASGTTTGGPTTLMVTGSTPARAAMQSRLTCSGAGCVSTMAQQTITQTVDGTATTYALDVGANLLPWVTATWLPPTTTMQVTVTGTGSYDLFQGAIRYTRGSVTQVIYTWRVFGPTAGTFKFPTLPSTVPGDPTIRVNDPQASYLVNVCESDAINGYRDAIKNPYVALGTCLASSSPDVVRFGGTTNRLSQSK